MHDHPTCNWWKAKFLVHAELKLGAGGHPSLVPRKAHLDEKNPQLTSRSRETYALVHFSFLCTVHVYYGVSKLSTCIYIVNIALAYATGAWDKTR